MSRIHSGIDIVEIQRIEQAVLSWQDSFLKRIYTEAELESGHNVASSLAARFAAKEAVMKALGIGARGMSSGEILRFFQIVMAPLRFGFTVKSFRKARRSE